jgi:hypothetical protein
MEGVEPVTRRSDSSFARYVERVNVQPGLFDLPEERIKGINFKTASKEERENAEYVGRANARYRLLQSPLHNPFKDGDRGTVIEKYKEHLLTSLREDPATAQEFSRLLGTLA